MEQHKRVSDREKQAIIKSFEEAERRIIAKLKARMLSLSKDKKLKEETLKDLNATFNFKPKE